MIYSTCHSTVIPFAGTCWFVHSKHGCWSNCWSSSWHGSWTARTV